MNSRIKWTLTPRHLANPETVRQYIKHAREWVTSGTATQSQLQLAWAVLKQWGSK